MLLSASYRGVFLTLALALPGCAGSSPMTTANHSKAGPWEIGTPIVAYYHGPGGGGGRWGPLTDGMARKLVDGGFNVAWGTSVEDLDVAHAHGLRVDLIAWDLREPEHLDDPEARARIDSVIDRVKGPSRPVCLRDHRRAQRRQVSGVREARRLHPPARPRPPGAHQPVPHVRQRRRARHVRRHRRGLPGAPAPVRRYRQARPDQLRPLQPLQDQRRQSVFHEPRARARGGAVRGAFPSSTSYRPFPWASPTAYPTATRAGTWRIPRWPTAARAFRISCTGPTQNSMEAFRNSKTPSGTPSAPHPTWPPR